MAGNVHNAGLGAVRPVQVGKAQLDGDAPLLFLLKPVGFNACQGLDQQGLAVVNVTGGTDDNMIHFSASATAAAMSWKSSRRKVRTSSRNRSRLIRPMMAGLPSRRFTSS